MVAEPDLDTLLNACDGRFPYTNTNVNLCFRRDILLQCAFLIFLQSLETLLRRLAGFVSSNILFSKDTSAPELSMDMDRIVFATDIQKKPPKWSTWGALEVAVKQNKWSGGSDGHVVSVAGSYICPAPLLKALKVLYRAQDGTIEDISYESDIEILGYAHRETVHITKPFDADAEGALQIGFDINIEQLPDWDSSVNNVENAGFDNGTFTFMDGNEVRTVAWRGTFIAMSDSSLDTVKAGSQPLPSWIEDFLAITPLEDDDDKVNEWTSSLVEEVCCAVL